MLKTYIIYMEFKLRIIYLSIHLPTDLSLSPLTSSLQNTSYPPRVRLLSSRPGALCQAIESSTVTALGVHES